MKLLKLRLGSLRGLLTVPGSIALVIWAMTIPLIWIDAQLQDEVAQLLGAALVIPYGTAEAVLSTAASAAITTLSLVYSLVLVVFTLAAGTIAPRLLRRFTGDRVNQVTAGLLGGIFLLSLTVLHQSDPDFIPMISVAVVMLLCGLSVLQLIFFVHSVSQSVTIDAEIAVISTELEERIVPIVKNGDDNRSQGRAMGGAPVRIPSAEAGYLGDIDDRKLLALACRDDVTVELLCKPGKFTLGGEDLAIIRGNAANLDSERLSKQLHACVALEPSRDASHDLEYLISLLVEIALRALSPGVNDTFTAVASIDRLSAALSDPVRRGLRNYDLVDEKGILRVQIPGMSVEDLLGAAFHPVRQASASNLLMLQHLADALARLHEIGNPAARTLIEHHGRLLLASCKTSNPLAEDYAFIERRMPFVKPEE